MKDPLLQLTDALREFGNSSDNAAETRARILGSLDQARRTSRRRSLVALPLAAILIGSLAMAATGARLPLPIRNWFAVQSSSPPKPGGPRGGVQKRRSVPSLAPNASTVNTAIVSEPPEAAPLRSASPRSDANRALAATATHRTHPTRAPEEERPISEEEYERYRVAHDAHFVRKDPAAALTAWSEYLSHSPTGRLAVEARYNRALCLLKLGRNREAVAALRPFTEGTYGAYRQREAQRLIAELAADAGR